MGAADFTVRVKATSAENAFHKARNQALHEHGHGGYTGSIAEKHHFVMIELPTGQDLQDYIEELIGSDPRIQDKFGPAGCIQLDENSYVFFGWASE